MLATKLSYRNPQYLEVVKCLLSYGADPKIKDGSGWSCLDEAVSQVNIKKTLFINRIG
jgi:ankyrin repeat protein